MTTKPREQITTKAPKAGDLRGVLFGAALSVVAVFVTSTSKSELGGPLLILGWGIFAWALHRYGRTADGR